MPGGWPEPFGLVAIEALATGTPVVARRIGALPEIIREGVDGFFGDDVTAMAFQVDRVAELDREAIRTSVIERFSVERMTDGYEAVYERLLSAGGAEPVAAAAACRRRAVRCCRQPVGGGAGRDQRRSTGLAPRGPPGRRRRHRAPTRLSQARLGLSRRCEAGVRPAHACVSRCTAP